MSTKPYAYCVERRKVEGRPFWTVGYYDDKGSWHMCGLGRNKRALERQAWEWAHYVSQLPLPENRAPRPRAPRTAGAGY